MAKSIVKRAVIIITTICVTFSICGCKHTEHVETEEERLQRQVESAQAMYDASRKQADDAWQDVQDLQNSWADYQAARDALGVG